MKKSVKQVLILLSSLLLTSIIIYLAAVFPALISLQNGNTNPPPPFDISDSGIYFSNPGYQIPATLFILLAPIVGTGIAFLLNGRKINLTVLLPMMVYYLMFIYFFYLHNIA